MNTDVDNVRLGLDFDNESSPSDPDVSELPWANSHSCMYHSIRQSSAANRLVPFSQRATPLPPTSLSRSSTNTCPPPPVHPATTVSSRFTVNSLRRLRLFRFFCRPSFQTPHTSARHYPHEPCRFPSGIRFLDLCRSVCLRLRERRLSFFLVRAHHADVWLPP